MNANGETKMRKKVKDQTKNYGLGEIQFIEILECLK